MIYVRFWGGNGYCGCDFEEYIAFIDNKEVDLYEYAYELSRDNAEAYEYIVYGGDGPDWDEITQEEYDEEIENYYASIDYDFEVMTKEDWLAEQGIEEDDE